MDTLIRFAAQLFTETSIRTLTSGTTPSSLLQVLSLLKDFVPDSLEWTSASHSLTLPLLQHVLLSHDTKAVSHDLRECAVLVLRKAVDQCVAEVSPVCREMLCNDDYVMCFSGPRSISRHVRHSSCCLQCWQVAMTHPK